MQSLYSTLFFNLITIMLFAQQPIGWASTGGGTTGGEGGQVVTVNTRSDLFLYASSPAPYVIQIEDTLDLNLYEMIEVSGNKTIVGIGSNAAIRYGGLEIRGNNVIVRNLEIFGSYDGDWSGVTHSTDGITVYGAQNVWIDHCWIHLCADGALDIRSDGPGNIGDRVTVSWTRFSDHNKVMLIGSSDNNTYNRDHLRVTLDHCWWDGTLEKGLNQRMPRTRFGDVHVLNNYYEDIDFYCAGVNFESDFYIENTYYRNSADPHVFSNIGEGIRDPECVAVGNIYEYASGTMDTGGDAFTPSDFYSYTADPTKEIPTIVMNGAGPFNPTDNVPPVAMTDEVELNNLTALAFIQPVENDTDADGGDLRLAMVINEPDGEWGIQSNLILYRPDQNSTRHDTLLYQLVDTQGGLDTGMIILYNPLVDTDTPLLSEFNLAVSPNPVAGLATISFKSESTEPVSLTLYDMRGRVHTRSFMLQGGAMGRQVYQMDTKGLPAGSYVVQLRQGTSLAAEQIVVGK